MFSLGEALLNSWIFLYSEGTNKTQKEHHGFEILRDLIFSFGCYSWMRTNDSEVVHKLRVHQKCRHIKAKQLREQQFGCYQFCPSVFSACCSLLVFFSTCALIWRISCVGATQEQSPETQSHSHLPRNFVSNGFFSFPE